MHRPARADVHALLETAAEDLIGARVVVVGLLDANRILAGLEPAEGIHHGQLVRHCRPGRCESPAPVAAARSWDRPASHTDRCRRAPAWAARRRATHRIPRRLTAPGVAHARLRHEIALIRAIDEHPRRDGFRVRDQRPFDGAAELIRRCVIEPRCGKCAGLPSSRPQADARR